jgi:DNA repair photolyase
MYCYAAFMNRFTGHAEPWGDFLDVKRCAKPVSAARLEGKTVLFSSVTDAYNPFEKRFGKTRAILEQFAGTGARIEILTKGALVTRDIDLFRRIPHIRVGISLNTTDDAARRALEPRASSVSERVSAIKRLRDEGFDTHVFLSPIFPGITDFRDIIRLCKDGAASFAFENLNLRGGYRGTVLRHIREQHPALVPLYDAIYRDGDMTYWETLKTEIADFCAEEKIAFTSYFYHEKIRKP